VLIEEYPAGLRLTPTGRKRYLALPNSAAFDSGAPDEGPAKIGRLLHKGA